MFWIGILSSLFTHIPITPHTFLYFLGCLLWFLPIQTLYMPVCQFPLPGITGQVLNWRSYCSAFLLQTSLPFFPPILLLPLLDIVPPPYAYHTPCTYFPSSLVFLNFPSFLLEFCHTCPILWFLLPGRTFGPDRLEPDLIIVRTPSHMDYLYWLPVALYLPCLPPPSYHTLCRGERNCTLLKEITHATCCPLTVLLPATPSLLPSTQPPRCLCVAVWLLPDNAFGLHYYEQEGRILHLLWFYLPTHTFATPL